MAIGGRGIISVRPTRFPREMTDMVDACQRGDFAAARAIQRQFLPLMQVNFVESNPGPVKSSMATMGLCEPVCRLPMVPPRPAPRKIKAVLRDSGLLPSHTRSTHAAAD